MTNPEEKHVDRNEPIDALSIRSKQIKNTGNAAICSNGTKRTFVGQLAGRSVSIEAGVSGANSGAGF